jgi:hypothetical protein
MTWLEVAAAFYVIPKILIVLAIVFFFGLAGLLWISDWIRTKPRAK